MMNRILLALKRPFIWLYRFRHRCGYGVHSPFAFNLITHVIYESTPYYKYEELVTAPKEACAAERSYVELRILKSKAASIPFSELRTTDYSCGCRQTVSLFSLSESR